MDPVVTRVAARERAERIKPTPEEVRYQRLARKLAKARQARDKARRQVLALMYDRSHAHDWLYECYRRLEGQVERLLLSNKAAYDIISDVSVEEKAHDELAADTRADIAAWLRAYHDGKEQKQEKKT